MDKSFITFNASSTSGVKSVDIEILLDDQLIYNNSSLLDKELIKVELPDDECDHNLKIILKNKTAGHTVLDSSGAIVQDTNLIVDNIKFDDIALNFNALQTATYTHDMNGTDQLKKYKFYGEMGCNGTVELKFTTPIYIWLLEHM